MKMFTKGRHKMCNAWVPISVTATFIDVVAQDNTNPHSCNVKLWILKQGYCKPACLHTCLPFGSCGKVYCVGFSAFWVPTVLFDLSLFICLQTLKCGAFSPLCLSKVSHYPWNKTQS